MDLSSTVYCSSLPSILHFCTNTLLPPRRTTTTITIPSSRSRLKLLPRRRHHNPNFKIVRNSIGRKKVVLEADEAELLLATCITRTLQPALTLEQGLDKIKDAVHDLESKARCVKAGMYRFQIAVSPGSKALSSFCSQDPSLGVFPQFFVSTEVEKAATDFVTFSRTRGVFGIGAAIYIKRPDLRASVQPIPFKRYQSVDSRHLMAYGLLDGSTISSLMKYENDSFYLFIPQIELAESEGLSILTATLAWDNSSLCVFEETANALKYLVTGQPLRGPSQRSTRTNASFLL